MRKMKHNVSRFEEKEGTTELNQMMNPPCSKREIFGLFAELFYFGLWSKSRPPRIKSTM